MTRLALGILLWSVVHFFPAVAAGSKKSLVSRIGEYPYKGIFTLLTVLSLYLIISGWQSTASVEIYAIPDWGGPAAGVLTLLAFILFFAPYPPNNFKRILRHPQLVGTILWGLGHLLSNGDERSAVLFGGLTAWAIVEILLINRRDGDWIKPSREPFLKDFSLILFSILAFTVVLFTHHMLFGGEPLT
jgi:uncharacterized membrane protein